MATEVKYVDISDHTPELLRLAEQVEKTGVPHVLRRDNEDIAIVRPANPVRAKRFRRKRVKPDDPIWNIVGMFRTEDGITDVSQDKDKYLADAYYAEFHPEQEK